MLPGPLELQRCQSGREAVNDHLHDPWSTSLCLRGTGSDFAIVLSKTTKMSISATNQTIRTHRIRLGGFGVLPMYVLRATAS